MSRKIKHLVLEADMPRAELRRAHGALYEVAEQIAHLGELLQQPSGEIPSNDAADIRQLATGVRAGATQAIVTAADVIGLAVRLEMIAAIWEGEQETMTEKRKGPARTGSLYWTKSGWRARIRVEVGGVVVQKSFDLETKDGKSRRSRFVGS